MSIFVYISIESYSSTASI